ncbi:FecR domain-containing protein [Pedobacter sp. FW305-3-2-15-E-R2A2]|uniref:FecR family protein n=1 Tax=Pedobacter sp. FW305-3-2-15-E-R2A2 TaxID=3140251 RepID=UPI00314025C0
MSREAFHLLLDRYLQGTCTDEEKRIVEELYGMLDKEDLEEINPREINTMEQKLWDRIHVDISTPETASPVFIKHSRRSSGMWTGIAAAVAGFLLITGYVFFKEETRIPTFLAVQSVQGVKECTNTSGKPEKITFEDGSSVILEKNAVVKYPAHFSRDVREVTLEGAGFFQISKDASRPFMVYSKDVITKVLGTSFMIRTSASGKSTEVSVHTGKVQVSPVSGRLAIVKGILGTDKAIFLTPNQKAVFISDQKVFEKTLVSNPEPVMAELRVTEVKDAFAFNDAPLAEVIAQLKKTYEIDFVVESGALYNNTFTGDLSEQSLYNKLDFLCESIKATYEISGTSIIIKSKK